jgi:hypothetical protein
MSRRALALIEIPGISIEVNRGWCPAADKLNRLSI